MLEGKPYYLHRLESELQERQRKNSAYSLRAYARFLGTHPSSLSAVLGSKRLLPLKTAHKIVERLNLPPEERHFFLDSLYEKKSRGGSRPALAASERLREEEHFKVIAEWEHYAILSLLETKGFQPKVSWIAKRLGISELRAKMAFNHLLSVGLIRKLPSGQYINSFANISTTEDVVSAALQQSHKENLELGIQKLAEVKVDARDYSASTLAVNPRRLKEAKTLIREFRAKLAALLESGEKTEVYHLCVQLYPVTLSEEK